MVKSWNYDKYLQWCEASIKKLLPILCVLCKAFWTFADLSSFGSVMILLQLWKIFIHSFSFPLTGGKHCRVCVEQWKDLPRLNVTPIMDLYSQNKFEKLISIFKVQSNPKENVDTRELAYIFSLLHAMFFSELPLFLTWSVRWSYSDLKIFTNSPNQPWVTYSVTASFKMIAWRSASRNSEEGCNYTTLHWKEQKSTKMLSKWKHLS